MMFGWMYQFYEKYKSQYIKQISSPFTNPWSVHSKDNKNKIFKHAEIYRHLEFVTADFYM